LTCTKNIAPVPSPLPPRCPSFGFLVLPVGLSYSLLYSVVTNRHVVLGAPRVVSAKGPTLAKDGPVCDYFADCVTSLFVMCRCRFNTQM